MVGGALENNRHCFFPRSLSSCNLLLPVKTKAASCKCFFDNFFYIYRIFVYCVNRGSEVTSCESMKE